MNSYSFITRLTASVARNFLQPMREPMTTVHDITIYEGYDELFGWHLGQDEMEDESSEPDLAKTARAQNKMDKLTTRSWPPHVDGQLRGQAVRASGEPEQSRRLTLTGAPPNDAPGVR